jgi:hypothetical protein
MLVALPLESACYAQSRGFATSVLFEQSTNFHAGYSFGYRHQFGSITDN